MNEDRDSLSPPLPEPLPFTWEAPYPILRNPFIWQALLMSTFLSTGVLGIILATMMGLKGRSEAVLPVLGFSLLIGLGLLVFFVLIALVFFEGRTAMRTTVVEEGVMQTMLSKASFWTSLLAIFAGTAGGSMGTAGSGHIALSNRTQAVSFDKVHSLEAFPERNEIHLRNRRRVVLQLFAEEEEFDTVLSLLRSVVENRTGIEAS